MTDNMTDAEVQIVKKTFDLVKQHSSCKSGLDRGVLVAMGDSWFDLEKFIFDFGKHILDQLEDLSYDVKSVASEGDTMEKMAYTGDQFVKLALELQKLKDDNKKPLAVLLSGGGNDIKNELKMMLNDQPASPPILNKKVVEDIIQVRLRKAYVRLLNLIDGIYKKIFESNLSIPVLVHGYAHAVPDGRGIWFLDSWLKTTFEKKGYLTLSQNTETVKCVIDDFNDMLDDLCKQKPFCSYVHYVDVRGYLTNDLGLYKDDWDDELHPSDTAFERVAKEFHKVIEKLP